MPPHREHVMPQSEVGIEIATLAWLVRRTSVTTSRSALPISPVPSLSARGAMRKSGEPVTSTMWKPAERRPAMCSSTPGKILYQRNGRETEVLCTEQWVGLCIWTYDGQADTSWHWPNLCRQNESVVCSLHNVESTGCDPLTIPCSQRLPSLYQRVEDLLQW